MILESALNMNLHYNVLKSTSTINRQIMISDTSNYTKGLGSGEKKVRETENGIMLRIKYNVRYLMKRCNKRKTENNEPMEWTG